MGFLSPEAEASYAQVCELLVAAGYFRARIPVLSPFDKLAGGIAWCITCASEEIDLPFHENGSIGQRIKIGETIERTLQRMGAPPLQAHQLTGLDLEAILPVTRFLLARVYGVRDQIGAPMLRLSLHQFELHCERPASPPSAPHLSALRGRYAPSRRFRLKGGAGSSQNTEGAAKHAGRVLLEYAARRAEGRGGSCAEEGESLDGGELGGEEAGVEEPVGEESELSQSRISALVRMGAEEIQQAALEFEQQSAHLMSSGVMAGVHRARAEREAAERRLAYEGGQLGLERSRLSEARSRLSSEREELQSLRSRAEEERTRGSELAAEVEGEVGEALGRLERVVQMSFELTEEARHTLSAHQTRMSEREHRLNLPASGEEQEAKLREVEAMHAAEKSKADRMRRLLAHKGRAVASLSRRLDEIASTAELLQYERRSRELHSQVGATLEETKKFYNSYNSLEESKQFVHKEISLLNSIHSHFVSGWGGGREKLVGSIDSLVGSVEASLHKVALRLEEEKARREAFGATYERLVEKERKYFKLVKDFQSEALRHEQLNHANAH